MAFEVPTDLIRQVQIAFRKDGGLSSFDPHDPTIPALPSLEASISGLDPSPPYLRCKHCKGKLLRGLQSLICIYCGELRKKDDPPEPIAFKSTFGYRWLLESLDLNGSETIGPSAEGSGFNKGQSTPKDEISLSELLDLQITWPDEPEKPGASFKDKSLDHSKSSLNLTAVDLDNFFSGSKRDIVSDASEEPPVISNQIESTERKAFVGEESFSLFQNVLPSETAVTSSFNASGDDSSGWQADFQSANSGNQHKDSRSVDPFLGSSVDLSAHIDPVFGHTEDLNDRKLNNDSAPFPSNDWIEDDILNNINSSASQQAEQFDSIVKAKDGRSPDNLNSSITESVDVDWFQDTKWQKNSANDLAINKYDDPFERSPQVDAASPPPLVNNLIQHDLLNNVSSPVSQQAEQFDLSIKSNTGLSSDSLNKQSSESVDWFQDNHWQTNIASAKDSMINKDDDSFDEWNDFTSSTGDQNPSKNSCKQSGDEIATASEQMSELSLFTSTNNFHEVDFSSSRSDLFSGSSSSYNHNDTREVINILSEVPTASRAADDKVGGSAEEPEKNGDVSNETTDPKDDAEMLMSKMHDLSFMLESNLSIPLVPDGLSSFPHD